MLRSLKLSGRSPLAWVKSPQGVPNDHPAIGGGKETSGWHRYIRGGGTKPERHHAEAASNICLETARLAGRELQDEPFASLLQARLAVWFCLLKCSMSVLVWILFIHTAHRLMPCVMFASFRLLRVIRSFGNGAALAGHGRKSITTSVSTCQHLPNVSRRSFQHYSPYPAYASKAKLEVFANK
jgi:hypothetical protein